MTLTYPQYQNGRFPLSMMVKLSGSGGLNHYLPPATAARWDALQARAKERTGRTLLIWGGWDAYRPYAEQVRMRSQACAAGNCNGAASPGTSSHGLIWEGRDAAAFDAGNWSYVYGGNRAAFFDDARSVGLSPGLINPSRNKSYPDEPWHVVDLNPWGPVPALDGSKAFPEQEDDMFTDADRADIQAIKEALGAGGLEAPGQQIADGDTVLGAIRDLRAKNVLTPDQDNALMSVYKAVFFGGGDAGSESIITRLAHLNAGVGQVDVGELAAQLKATLPAAIVAELGKELSS